MIGENEGDHLGAAVAGLGDVTGDGLDDFAIGAPYHGGVELGHPGAVYIVAGPADDNGSLEDAVWGVIQGTGAVHIGVGIQIGGGLDANGDGVTDLLVGGYKADDYGIPAYIMPGPLAGELWLGEGGTALRASECMGGGCWFGLQLDVMGDMDGDGETHLFVGGQAVGGEWGLQTLVTNTIDLPMGEWNLEEPAETVISFEDVYGLEFSIHSAGDVDGDGMADMIVGTPHLQEETIHTMSLFFIYGPPVPGTVSLEKTSTMIMRGSSTQFIGGNADGVGDLDGDGYDEFASHGLLSASMEGVFIVYGRPRS